MIQSHILWTRRRFKWTLSGALVFLAVAGLSAQPTRAQTLSVPLKTLTPLLPTAGNSHFPSDVSIAGQHYNNAIESTDWNKDWTEVGAPDGQYQTWRWTVSYSLSGQFKRLIVDAGIADGVQSDRIDHFEIHTNGKNLGITPPMHTGDTPEHFDLDVTGVLRLDLIVTSDVHDGNGGKDGAVWGDPTLYSDSAPTPRAADNLDVFSWQEVPQDSDVPIVRAVMDSRGYHLFDTQNEVIVVPFTQTGGETNIWLMQIGRSPDERMHFVNNGDAPVLYIPQDAYIALADVPNACWYPVTSDFHSSTPVYEGIALDTSDYESMVWYPDMVVRSGFKASFGRHSDRTVVNIGNTQIVMGADKILSWFDYDSYKATRNDGSKCAPWDQDHYDMASHPPPSHHGFDHDKHFGSWQGPDVPPNNGAHPNPPVNGQAPPLQMVPPHPIERTPPPSNGMVAPPTNPTLPVSHDPAPEHDWAPPATGPLPGEHKTIQPVIQPQPAPTPTPTPSSAPKPLPAPIPNGTGFHTAVVAKGSVHMVPNTVKPKAIVPKVVKPAPTPTPSPTPTPTPAH